MKLVKIVFILFFISYTALTGCKQNLEAPPGASVGQLISSDEKYALLAYALEKAGYMTLLSTTPNITVLAPDSTALKAALNIQVKEDIDAMNDEQLYWLRYFLGYHIIGRSVVPSKITAGGSIETLSVNRIFTSNTGTHIYVNGMQLPGSYRAAANGTIYDLPGALKTPTQTLDSLIKGDPSLSFYARAIALDTFTAFKSLSSTYTVFAPVNDAFRSSGFTSEAQLDALSRDSLRKIINFHAVSNNSHIVSTDFVHNTRLTTMADSIILQQVQNRFPEDVSIYAPYQGAVPAIPFLTRDSIAINGVLFRINSLLTPR